jgi:hypothetical protein
VDKVTWLQANKYHSTKEYAKLNAAKKVWIHQLPSDQAQSCCCVARAGESDDNGDLFEDHNNASVLSKRSTWPNLTNLRLSARRRKPHAASDRLMN